MKRSRRNIVNRGATLVESLVAIAVLAIGVTSVLALFGDQAKTVKSVQAKLAPESIRSIVETYVGTSMGKYWRKQNAMVDLCPRLRAHITNSLTPVELAEMNMRVTLVEEALPIVGKYGPGNTPYRRGTNRCNNVLNGVHGDGTSGVNGPDVYSGLRFCLRIDPLNADQADGQIHEFAPALVEVRYDLMNFFHDTRRSCDNHENTHIPGVRLAYSIYWVEKAGPDRGIPFEQAYVLYIGK